MSLKFAIPLLKRVEIIDCLNQLDIGLSLDDLVKPTEVTIYSVYQKLVELLMGEDVESLASPNIRGVDHIASSSHDRNSMVKMGMFRSIIRLASLSGVADFSINDIVRPTPPRTAKVLSAIINFAKYRQDCIDAHSVQLDSTNATSERIASMRGRLAVLSEEKSRLQHISQQDIVIIQELENSIASITGVITSMNDRQAELNEARRVTKERVEHFEVEIAEKSRVFEEISGEVSTLSMRVVRSPQKLQHALSVAEHDVAKEKANNLVLSEKIDAVRAQIRMFNSVYNMLYREVQVLKLCVGDQDKITELQTLNNDAGSVLREAFNAVQKLKLVEKGYLDELESVETLLYNQEKSMESRRLTCETSLEELTVYRDRLLQQNRQSRDHLRVLDAKCTQKEREVRDSSEAHLELMKKSKDVLTRLYVLLNEYHAQLTDKMSKTN